MKKLILVLLMVLFSVTMFAQTNSIDSDPFIDTITQEDLPLGKTFALVPLDGSTIVTGVITEETITDLPKNWKFVLKVTGLEVKKYLLK